MSSMTSWILSPLSMIAAVFMSMSRFWGAMSSSSFASLSSLRPFFCCAWRPRACGGGTATCRGLRTPEPSRLVQQLGEHRNSESAPGENSNTERKKMHNAQSCYRFTFTLTSLTVGFPG